MPSARNAEYKKWREKWLSENMKTRVSDKDFQKKKQINSEKVFSCEKHFKLEDVELCKYCCCYVRFLDVGNISLLSVNSELTVSCLSFV